MQKPFSPLTLCVPTIAKMILGEAWRLGSNFRNWISSPISSRHSPQRSEIAQATSCFLDIRRVHPE